MKNQTNDRFDYQAEADKTCSVEWGAHNVTREDFLRNLRIFIETASVLNVYKKLLFRGKTPEQLGMPKPELRLSLEGFIKPSEIDLVHGIVGTATEAGELAEILYDMINVFSKTPDRVNAVEECGDIRWYLNRVLRWAKVSDEECERANIAKLHGRGFQFGFDKTADSNRDLTAERAILEAGVQAKPDRTLHLPLGPHGDEEPE